MSTKSENKIIFPGKCLDSNDPLMLGRIRAVPETENEQEIMGSISTNCAIYDPTNNQKVIDIKPECKWTSDDPFLFLPLLPFHLYGTPKQNEYVHIIFSNKDFKYQSQFYIPGVFSSPMSSVFENYQSSKTFLASGVRNKTTLDLKNQQNEYRDDRSKGVFPEPEDNALIGRGSTDVVLKKDEVLIRAGKYSGILEPNTFPVGNLRRSFLQLSNFTQRKVDLPPYTYAVLKEQVKTVKKLIEWNIFNPDNQFNTFTGNISLYNVNPDESTNTKNFKVDSDVSNFTSAPIYQLNFAAETFENVVLKINSFIKGVNDGRIDIVSAQTFNVPQEIFPVIFRPGQLTYQYLKNFDGINNVLQYANVFKFYRSVKLNEADNEFGFGLIFRKDKIGEVYDPVITEAKPSEYISVPVTYASLGGENIFLLSHKSSIPSKGEIDFRETLYGISQEKFTDEIFSKTNSMVRGEQLMDFLNLMTKFLISHVHPFPGLPPVPIAIDGTQSAQILKSLLDAPNTILNQNIRIN